MGKVTEAIFVKVSPPSRIRDQLVRSLIKFQVVGNGDIAESHAQALTYEAAKPMLEWLSKNAPKGSYYSYSSLVSYVICFFDDRVAVMAKLAWDS